MKTPILTSLLLISLILLGQESSIVNTNEDKNLTERLEAFAELETLFPTCGHDSIEYKAITNFFEENGDSFGVRSLDYKILKKRRNTTCHLKIYAKVFDILLDKDLDLDYDCSKKPLGINSVYVMTFSELEKASYNEFAKKLERNNLSHKLFRDFLYVKRTYERRVLSLVHQNENYSLEIEIEYLINYGTYNHPVTVKAILMSEYAHLSREKLQKDCGH